MQITLTMDLTPKTLTLLEKLCDPGPMMPIPGVFETDKPAEPNIEPVLHEEHKNNPSAADVKAVCLKFSKAGRQAELKAAFAKFGAKKLTEISEADYTALLEELGDD